MWNTEYGWTYSFSLTCYVVSLFYSLLYGKLNHDLQHSLTSRTKQMLIFAIAILIFLFQVDKSSARRISDGWQSSHKFKKVENIQTILHHDHLLRLLH